ncbi:MAG: signal peptidase I [Candidatus Schekmanbacteria bacterium]|nr:signal peptidase I [Candidatus Schekmanbacteria bacterium]
MPPENKPNEIKKKSIVREYAEALIVAVVLALVIRTFIVQAFKIPSGSMLETLQIGDHILVNKFIYYFTDPKRGDIIVFKYPENPSRDFIKRVIGLPGETLQVKDQVVYINGQPLSEAYTCHELGIDPELFIRPRDNFGPVTIPQNQYFMMGDNRDSSMDSRYWGALKNDMIRGKAFVIYWSIAPVIYRSEPALMEKIGGYFVKLPSRIRWQRFGKLIH